MAYTLEKIQVNDRVAIIGYKGAKGMDPNTALYAIKLCWESRFSLTRFTAKVIDKMSFEVTDPNLRDQFYERIAYARKACANGVIMFYLNSDLDGAWFIGKVESIEDDFKVFLKKGSVRSLTDWEPYPVDSVALVACHKVPYPVEMAYEKVVGL